MFYTRMMTKIKRNIRSIMIIVKYHNIIINIRGSNRKSSRNHSSSLTNNAELRIILTSRMWCILDVTTTINKWPRGNQNRNKCKSNNQYQQNNQVHNGGDSKISSADISPDVQRVWDNILKWSKQAGKSHEPPIDSSKTE